jgi:hypothetical protein
MALRLQRNLTLPEARKMKARLADSLSTSEAELLDILARGNVRVFGEPHSSEVLLTTTSKATRLSVRMREEKDSMVLVPLGTAAENLMRMNWLRYHPGPIDDSGYFYLTEEAEKVLRALSEGK